MLAKCSGFGDRRQEIVFIGVNMDEAKIVQQRCGKKLCYGLWHGLQGSVVRDCGTDWMNSTCCVEGCGRLMQHPAFLP
eukprot:1160527-Pelagomonas_calceolata.AAC.3